INSDSGECASDLLNLDMRQAIGHADANIVPTHNLKDLATTSRGGGDNFHTFYQKLCDFFHNRSFSSAENQHDQGAICYATSTSYPPIYFRLSVMTDRAGISILSLPLFMRKSLNSVTFTRSTASNVLCACTLSEVRILPVPDFNLPPVSQSSEILLDG